MDPISLAVGVVIGIVGGKAVKEIIVSIFPQTAPVFLALSVAQRQLKKVVDCSSEFVKSSEEVKKLVEDKKLKIAQKLL